MDKGQQCTQHTTAVRIVFCWLAYLCWRLARVILASHCSQVWHHSSNGAHVLLAPGFWQRVHLHRCSDWLQLVFVFVLCNFAHRICAGQSLDCAFWSQSELLSSSDMHKIDTNCPATTSHSLAGVFCSQFCDRSTTAPMEW